MQLSLDNQTLRRSLDAAAGVPEVVMMIPAYYRLYMLLRSELLGNATADLPTTQKGLAERYGVCRGTATAALALLNRDGLVKPSRRGRPRSLDR